MKTKCIGWWRSTKSFMLTSHYCTLHFRYFSVFSVWTMQTMLWIVRFAVSAVAFQCGCYTYCLRKCKLRTPCRAAFFKTAVIQLWKKWKYDYCITEDMVVNSKLKKIWRTKEKGIRSLFICWGNIIRSSNEVINMQLLEWKSALLSEKIAWYDYVDRMDNWHYDIYII